MSSALRVLLSKEQRLPRRAWEAALLLGIIAALILFGFVSVGALSILSTTVACSAGLLLGCDGVPLGGSGTRGRVAYEMLFTLPVRRRTILHAKLVAAALVTLAATALPLALCIAGLRPWIWGALSFDAPVDCWQAPPWAKALGALAVSALGLTAGLYAGVRSSVGPPVKAMGRNVMHVTAPVALAVLLTMAVELPMRVHDRSLERTLAETEALLHEIAVERAREHPGDPELARLAASTVTASLPRSTRLGDLLDDRAVEVGLAAVILLSLGGSVLYVRAAGRAIEEREVPEG